MEIRKEEKIPSKQRKISMNFPQLLDLQPGMVIGFPLADLQRVRQSCAYLNSKSDVKYVLRSDPSADEVTVRVVAKVDK